MFLLNNNFMITIKFIVIIKCNFCFCNKVTLTRLTSHLPFSLGGRRGGGRGRGRGWDGIAETKILEFLKFYLHINF